MYLNSLPLLTYCLSNLGQRRACDTEGKPAFFFFSTSDAPEGAEVLSGTRAIISRRGFTKSSIDPKRASFPIGQENWWQPDFWNELFDTRFPTHRGGTAIFSSPFEEIPPFAFNALKKRGFSDLIYLSFGEWRQVDLHSNIAFSGRRLWRAAVNLTCRARDKVDMQLRKIILKLFSTPIYNSDGVGYKPVEGFGYSVRMAEYTSIADACGVEKSPLLLFEEKILLQPHQPHSSIFNEGLGRYSHWTDSVIFSASDNTDPNTNGRRYRYVVLRGWASLLKPLFHLCERHNVTDSMRQAYAACNSGDSAWRPTYSYKPVSIGMKLRERPEISFAEHVAREIDNERKSTLDTQAPKGAVDQSDEICMYIGSLAAGGSERQLSYLALGLKESGRKMRILIPQRSGPESLHYYPPLEAAGIDLQCVNEVSEQFSVKSMLTQEGLQKLWLLESMPNVFASEVFALYSHLIQIRPRVLHCWLDHTNVVGAIAGWLAGVPQIVLSARSVNPTHFPPLYREWYQGWYKQMLRSPRVKLTANSRAGAVSYAEWLSIPVESIAIVHNGVDPTAFKTLSNEQKSSLRSSLGIPSTTPLLCGVMRFTSEKRPLRFVRLVLELKKVLPELRVILVGDGPLRTSVERDIHNLGLQSSLKLLGRRDDVAQLIGISNALLLTSYMEGLPNVLMEAQMLNCPVVAPNVGGVPEVVEDGVGGYLCDKDDIATTIQRLKELLTNIPLNTKMGLAGREFIKTKFSQSKMIDSFCGTYTSRFSSQLNRDNDVNSFSVKHKLASGS